MPFKPAYYQNKLDRLNTMAQKGPLNPAQQRTMSNLQTRLGPQIAPAPYNDPPPPPPGPGLASTIQGDGGIKGVMGKLLSGQSQAGGPQLPPGPIQGGPISGPGAPLPAGGGGVAAPGTSNMPNAPLPPGAMYKKGGKVKKMASGGMTSKVSSASRRGDGIAQRGKTKGRML